MIDNFGNVFAMETGKRSTNSIGNTPRNWGRPLPVPVIVTEFEVQLKRLGIDRSEYVSSRQLLRWCERNRNRVYVPEWLLEAWGLQVDVIFSWAA